MQKSFVAAGAVSMLALAFAPGSVRAAPADDIFANGFEVPGFTVHTPDIVVPAGTSTTWCYYFRTPNTGVTGIKRWASTMGPGLYMVLFLSYDSAWNPVERNPPGTLAQGSCGLSDGAGGFAAWTYAAHHASEELVPPTDDGSGTPLAFELAAGQPAFLQLHVFNAGDQPLTTSATLEADALAPATAYTKTASYLTLNSNIAIGPGSTQTVQDTCAVPSATKFWWISTHTHHYATQSSVLDGSSTLVSNAAWDNPQAVEFGPPAFHAFTPAGMTTTCSYFNSGSNTVHFGEDDQNDETCEGIGLFFPATRPGYCYNGAGPL